MPDTTIKTPTADPAARSEDATGRLVSIWKETLGVADVGINQNYFDLGGDSALAVQLFSRIEKAFHIKLPLATLFEAPTIEELARVVEQDMAESSWSSLVPIQPNGSRPPFFCIHGAGGNVLIYRELSQSLGPDQPFYGLQAQGLDGKLPPLEKIEDMAARYVKEIRRLKAHGPYLIGGYCMGGTIAFEMAQQLRAEGEEVSLLALFDTTDWSKIRIPTALDKLYFFIERFGFHVANYLRLDVAGRKEFFSEKLQSFRNRVPVWRGMLLSTFGGRNGSGIPESRLLGEIWRLNDRACIEYKPKPYPGSVADFRPIQQYRIFDKPGAKWDRLAEKGQLVIVLPVYPAGMLLQPFVKHLASALRQAIDDAVGRRQ